MEITAGAFSNEKCKMDIRAQTLNLWEHANLRIVVQKAEPMKDLKRITRSRTSRGRTDQLHELSVTQIYRGQARGN